MDIVFIMIFMLAFGGIGLYTIIKAVKRRQRCVEVVNAICVDYKESQGDDGTVYAPVFRYEYGGENYRGTYDVSSSSKSYKIGQEVRLKVNPENPKEFCPEVEIAIFVLGGVFTAVGGLMVYLLFLNIMT